MTLSHAAAARLAHIPPRPRSRSSANAAPAPRSLRPGQARSACACGGACPRCRGAESNGRLARAAEERHRPHEAASGAAPRVVQEALRSPGEPLDTATRARMEASFGRDFGHVRLHRDAPAARSAQAVAARAYTVGSQVVLAPGQYAPGAVSGQRLLAHELAHVVQHSAVAGARVPPSAELRIGARDDPLEREVDAVADAVPSAARPLPAAHLSREAGAPVLRRQPLNDPAVAPAGTDAGVPADAPAPAPTWSSDLVNIFLLSDREDCLGTASPSDVLRYSDCGSPVKPPFCQTARVPFKVQFFVDRGNAPIEQPFRPPRVRVRMEFVTTGGRQTLNTDASDPAPRYLGPNEPLAARFGTDFPVGSTESGTLTVRLEMRGVKGFDVVYTDSIGHAGDTKASTCTTAYPRWRRLDSRAAWTLDAGRWVARCSCSQIAAMRQTGLRDWGSVRGLGAGDRASGLGRRS